MWHLVLAQLRHRWGRSLALVLGILVATTAFTVLTGSAQTQRLEVRGATAASFRSAYDVLVRPRGARTELERARGVVQPNFLSGIFGGITVEAYERIKAIPGVDVAAPIAMVSYGLPAVATTGIDLTRESARAPRSLFRVRTVWTSDRGLSRFPDANSYVYVTRNRLVPPSGEGDGTGPTLEAFADGRRVPVCRNSADGPGAFTTKAGAIRCWSLRNGFWGRGFGAGMGGLTGRQIGVAPTFSIPLLIAAVDPAAEAELTDLHGAVVSGRYLRARESTTGSRPDEGVLPVLASARNYLDETAVVTVERLPEAAAARVPGAVPPSRELAAVPGTTVHAVRVSADDAYRQLLAQLQGRTNRSFFAPLDGLWAPGPTRYRGVSGGRLAPVPVSNPDSVWKSDLAVETRYVGVPISNADRAFRALTPHKARWAIAAGERTPPVPVAVGVFDPDKLPAFNPLSDVPLGAYEPPRARPADAGSTAALGGRDLLPNRNLGGYLAQPPQLITTLDALPILTSSVRYDGDLHAQDPISVIRVRVAGVTGPDPVSREKIRMVAQQIALRTGLDVDVTAGSSPTPTTVEVPAGKFGRPALALSENWVRKGVAVAILSALDRKSVALFVLILGVCGLFVANAASAAVRARRTELGVLSCLGWSARTLFAAALGEVALLGLVAGLVGSAAAVPLGHALGLRVDLARAALAIPAAVVLAVLAATGPAWRASRATPAEAVRPAVQASRRARHPRGVLGLAVTNVGRVPGRSALGALSLAIGVCGLTLLVAVTLAFRGVLVGSLLGDAISVQIRSADYLAVATIVLLGVAGVADVLYLGIRERAAELSTLRVTGWPEAALTRLVTYEGVLIGASGALLGAAAGVAGATTLAGEFVPRTAVIAAVVALVATAIEAVACVVPTRQLRRLPTAVLLAEE